MTTITDEILSLEEIDLIIKIVSKKREGRLEALKEVEEMLLDPENSTSGNKAQIDMLLSMKSLSIKAYEGAINEFTTKEVPRQQKELKLLADIITKLYVLKINAE